MPDPSASFTASPALLRTTLNPERISECSSVWSIPDGMAVSGAAQWLSMVSILALCGCKQSDVKLAAESVYQQCGRRLDYDGCETRLWKRDHQLAGRFMGYFGEQEIMLGEPVRITYHDDERIGSDGRGPYVETFSTLHGTKGKAIGTLRFTKVENRWLMTEFKFEPMQ